MPKTPSDDPSSEWPEEIKKAYENLKIPSLYDAVLTNEKLSLELRRQDRELKSIFEAIQTLSDRFNTLTQMIEEGWEEEFEENEGDLRQLHNFYQDLAQRGLGDLEIELVQSDQLLEKQMQDILLETHDHIRDLSQSAKKVIHQLMILLTKEEVSSSISYSPKIIEEMFHAIIEAIEKTRYQIIKNLEEIHIALIDPPKGELFDASRHHALEYIEGGKEGTVAQVVQVGYQQDQNVLRMADVIVYSG